MDQKALIGTWRLISWETRSVDGKAHYPWGQHLIGYLIYTHDGYMSASIMRPNRSPFADGSLLRALDLVRASTEEKLAAVESYLAYCGRYVLDGDRVIHHVEMSLFPNWIGGDQERFGELEGNRLILSTKPFLQDGNLHTPRLIWERVGT